MKSKQTPIQSNSSRICLVRHGETAWNTERRLQGHIDIPLNETGLSQAEATAMTRRLAREEGIFAGMSSGGAVHVATKLIAELEEGEIAGLTDQLLSLACND